MTAQAGERLLIDGKEQTMCTKPLETYFSMVMKKPAFRLTSTSLWRGYVGRWEIVDSRLYLIGLSGQLQGRTKPAVLGDIFPDYPDRVFAHWYTGQLRIPIGKMLHYVHSGHDSTYEADLKIDVVKGVVAKAMTHLNGVSDEFSESDGYRIGASFQFAPSVGEKA